MIGDEKKGKKNKKERKERKKKLKRKIFKNRGRREEDDDGT